MKTDQSAFLNHILDAIKKIEKYLQGIDEEAFTKNDLVQDGVIRQIEIIWLASDINLILSRHNFSSYSECKGKCCTASRVISSEGGAL
jgi:hypothetical protein